MRVIESLKSRFSRNGAETVRKVNGWSPDNVHQPTNPAYHGRLDSNTGMWGKPSENSTRNWGSHNVVGEDYFKYVGTIKDIPIPHTLDLYTPAHETTGDIVGATLNRIDARVTNFARDIAATARLYTSLGNPEERHEIINRAQAYGNKAREEFMENFETEKKAAKTSIVNLWQYTDEKGKKQNGIAAKFLFELWVGGDTRDNTVGTLIGAAVLTGAINLVNAADGLSGNQNSSSGETSYSNTNTPGGDTPLPCEADLGTDVFVCGKDLRVTVGTPPLGDSDDSGFGYVSVSAESNYGSPTPRKGSDQRELEPGQAFPVTVKDPKTHQTRQIVFVSRYQAGNPATDFTVSATKVLK